PGWPTKGPRRGTGTPSRGGRDAPWTAWTRDRARNPLARWALGTRGPMARLDQLRHCRALDPDRRGACHRTKPGQSHPLSLWRRAAPALDHRPRRARLVLDGLVDVCVRHRLPHLWRRGVAARAAHRASGRRPDPLATRTERSVGTWMARLPPAEWTAT